MPLERVPPADQGFRSGTPRGRLPADELTAAYPEWAPLATAAARRGSLLLEGPLLLSRLAYFYAIAAGSGSDVVDADALAIHPDVLILEGADVKAEDARDAREWASIPPMILGRRHLLIGGIDGLGRVPAQVLLKVVEEPPATAFLGFSAADRDKVSPILASRLATYPLRKNDADSPRLLGYFKIEDAARRLDLAGGDVDLAASMDLAAVEGWLAPWAKVAEGGSFPASALQDGVDEFAKSGEGHRLACWTALAGFAVSGGRGADRWWREIAGFASSEAARVAAGSSSRVSTQTAFVQAYARAASLAPRR